MFYNKPDRKSFTYPPNIEERKQPKKYIYWVVGGVIILIGIILLAF